MKWLLMFIIFVPLLAASLAVAADPPTCDLKRVSKVLYCEKDDRILNDEDVGSGKPEFGCDACGTHAKQAGACPKCEQDFTEKAHAKGTCKTCGGTPVKADACVKDAFSCPKCAAVQPEKGRCAACDTALKKVPHYALVKHSCAGCGTTQTAAGKCTKEDCSHAGKPMGRVCSQAGTAPHVAVAATTKPKKAKKPKKGRKPKKDGPPKRDDEPKEDDEPSEDEE